MSMGMGMPPGLKAEVAEGATAAVAEAPVERRTGGCHLEAEGWRPEQPGRAVACALTRQSDLERPGAQPTQEALAARPWKRKPDQERQP
mmetsp:Transcript_28116/g.61387  ORF Transcript_28116/g.61387 Transcript_28116/m.61387 type:complete len:89 (-) Transcript_28116:25-291(-)